MTRRDWLRTASAGGVGTVVAGAAPVLPSLRYSARATDLVWESGVVDMLGLITADWKKLARWRSDPATLTDEEFERIAGSGVAAFHPAVHLPSKDPRRSTERWFRGWLRIAESHPDKFLVMRTADDAAAARPGERAALLLGSQNSTHFGSIPDVGYFASLGQRVSQLTYNGANRLGYGCRAGADRGLTDFGAEVVAAMNRAGMLVDVSHAGPRTALEAVRASAVPVVASHTNCRAITPNEPRCISDELIREVAAGGGVVGLTGIRKFVGGGSLANYLDHFEHVIRLVGPEHVGIGSDADLEGRQPVLRDLSHGEFVFSITEGLVRRGLSDADIRLILGGNFRRVLTAVLPAA